MKRQGSLVLKRWGDPPESRKNNKKEEGGIKDRSLGKTTFSKGEKKREGGGKRSAASNIY